MSLPLPLAEISPCVAGTTYHCHPSFLPFPSPINPLPSISFPVQPVEQKNSSSLLQLLSRSTAGNLQTHYGYPQNTLQVHQKTPQNLAR